MNNYTFYIKILCIKSLQVRYLLGFLTYAIMQNSIFSTVNLRKIMINAGRFQPDLRRTRRINEYGIFFKNVLQSE